MIDSQFPDFNDTPAAPGRAIFGYAPKDLSSAPFVTIVTPFFNTGPVFHETAVTVFRQSFQQWEWLIINDGSTDLTSLSVLDRYRNADARIRILDAKGNQGPSAARNTGYAAARGRYVVQLDSDNLLEPTAIEKWFWYLESYPEYAFVKGLSVGFGAQTYLWNRGFHEGKIFLEANLIDATSMVRQSAHQTVHGYDVAIRDGLEDWEFWLRCANAGLWGGTVPEYLDWYRRRVDHSDRWKDWDEGKRQDSFRQSLRQKYPRLWNGGFPRIEPAYASPGQIIEEDLPCNNLLRKQGQHVLFLIPWMTMGGADKFNIDLIKLLTKRGWKATIATTLKGDQSWYSAFTRLTPDVFILNHFLRAKDYPRFLRYLIESRDIDTIVVTQSELGYALLPYLRAHFPGKTFLDFCHMEEESWKNGGYPRMSVDNDELLDMHVVSSNHLRSWMTTRGVESTRISVCYTGIDVQEWMPDVATRNSIRTEMGIEDDVPIVFYAGRLCDQKRPHLLCRILENLAGKDCRFVALIAGDGPDLQFVRHWHRRRNLKDKVRILGAVSNDKVKRLMMAADIFLLPSAWEGIALTIYEAMACAVVVVASDVGGQNELVTKETGILIPKTDEGIESPAYVEALTTLIGDPEKRRDMGNAGRQRVIAEFPLEGMGERMVELFETASLESRLKPRSLIGPGLGRLCASRAIECERLSELADTLWIQNGGLLPARSNSAAEWRRQLFRVLYKWHEPLYRWYSPRGWTWMKPIRDRIRRLLLGSPNSIVASK